MSQSQGFNNARRLVALKNVFFFNKIQLFFSQMQRDVFHGFPTRGNCVYSKIQSPVFLVLPHLIQEIIEQNLFSDLVCELRRHVNSLLI